MPWFETRDNLVCHFTDVFATIILAAGYCLQTLKGLQPGVDPDFIET
ncbi:MAG: hypothetical protein ACD_39C00060G0001 [uncultured bacterium]|nr:MAG: hypothetical protein ACD_39C00060G0001 [uncultured bacterium]